MRIGMTKDFSWSASAREYGKIYEKVRIMRAQSPSSEGIAANGPSARLDTVGAKSRP